MPFNPNQPYAIASGGGGQWYEQDGQAYALNGVAITAPVIPASRDQATGPFTGLSDVPASYAGQGGKSVTVKESEDGIEFVAGGESGASVFTDLTDAPATITADAVVVGNHAGDAVEMRNWVTINDNDRTVYASAPNPDPDGYGVGFVAQNADASNVAMIYTSDNFSQMRLTKGEGNTGIDIRAYQDVTEVIFRDDFKLTGADVVASDATATLTVNAVEYSIAKAIKVEIGSSTYFWPLFGPVAP
jgi:hypothetical protein